MTRSLCTALLAFAILPACAPITTNTGGGGAGVASGTYYCWKSRYYEDSGKLMCNWTDSLKAACELSTHRSIPAAQIATGPTAGKKCANGEALVEVTVK
ncbi:hypothetical protein [Usitatibacter palustris]|uniref:Uncharacterized protein n=1 Tax=Usitatibacter palustris TaxID=2732487 RepID=A0A6M4H6U2_9PROT|nr:hypothetical protein [Usitatibacter palustris]QJR15339.1 hypothetical protein DSM104440_02158 [Usitatibacter palustris]